MGDQDRQADLTIDAEGESRHALCMAHHESRELAKRV